MNEFGVAVSPFDVDQWQAATGIVPDLCMVFESWSRRRDLTPLLAKARAVGHHSIMITWEPWEPTALGLSNEEQGAPQPYWSSRSILDGVHDDYIDTTARAMRDSGLTVWLRYGHEMNGPWHPWFHDPDAYVAAWKYLRTRIRMQRGAWNVKFVWSPNPDLWRASPADWLRRLLPYWPGGASVDAVGFTMIEFGGSKHYPVGEFRERFDLARRVFGETMVAPEVNVSLERAAGWLDGLAGWMREDPLRLVVLSQGPSRAEAVGGTGRLSWSVMDHRELVPVLRRVVTGLHQ